jgi:hypothetical protein
LALRLVKLSAQRLVFLAQFADVAAPKLPVDYPLNQPPQDEADYQG